MSTWAIALELGHFLVVNPGSAQVCLPGLSVSENCPVHQQLVFSSSVVTTKPSLGPAHVLSHMPTHLAAAITLNRSLDDVPRQDIGP